MDREIIETFSNQLNFTFGILNELTKQEIFKSSVSDDEFTICIMGRDSHYDFNLEPVGSGMMLPNPLVDIIKSRNF